MKVLNIVSSLVLIAFSGLIIASALQLGFGSFSTPGPGFMGFLAGGLLLGLSLAIFLSTILGRRKEVLEQKDLSLKNTVKPLLLVVALCLYTLVVTTIGFLVATTALVFAMLYMYSPKKPLVHLVVALIITNFTYLVFVKWLAVVLPSGRLGLVW